MNLKSKRYLHKFYQHPQWRDKVSPYLYALRALLPIYMWRWQSFCSVVGYLLCQCNDREYKFFACWNCVAKKRISQINDVFHQFLHTNKLKITLFIPCKTNCGCMYEQRCESYNNIPNRFLTVHTLFYWTLLRLTSHIPCCGHHNDTVYIIILL